MMSNDVTQPIERAQEVCTAEQLSVMRQYVAAGWLASHIAEYPTGYLNVWLVTKHHKTELSKGNYTHAYIKPNGKVRRL